MLLMVFLCASYHLYFLFLLPEVRKDYLYYLDFLLLLVLMLWFGVEFASDRKWRKEKEKLLQQDIVIWKELSEEKENHPVCRDAAAREQADREIVEHDIAVLEERFREQFRQNCELQDYFAKWCHEIKIPLAASLCMTEKIQEPSLKESMREQLEHMNVLLHSALLGTKIQSSLFDLQIRETSLMECVRNSIHNHQFFLIRNHFTVQIQNNVDIWVYTDPSWLTYVLDQLTGNAVKYAGESSMVSETSTEETESNISPEKAESETLAEETESKTLTGESGSCPTANDSVPRLNFYVEGQEGSVRLCVEDNGEGIKEQDIRRIFEKGYTGSNHHNGRYKSTGMGLYMASVILERLGHEIRVESEYGRGTRIMITFHYDRNVRFSDDL